MREFRMGQAATLLGVSPDTVRRWADSGRVKTRRTQGGHRVVSGGELAALARTLNEAPPPGVAAVQSARNRLTGIVTSVTRDKVMAQVEIQAGPHRVVSLISREGADQLALEAGTLVAAVIKATNVTVELLPGE